MMSLAPSVAQEMKFSIQKMKVCLELSILSSPRPSLQYPVPIGPKTPDPMVRPSLKNPKSQFFGLGLTQ